MCVIVFKDYNKKIPSLKLLKECWNKNSDGAGIFVAKKDDTIGKVYKGIMSFEEFSDIINTIDIEESDLVVYHFRIATSGGINKEKTHPFLISDLEEELNITGEFHASEVFFHNGVFSTGTNTLSDTQLFVKNILYPYYEKYYDYPNMYNKEAITYFIEKNAGVSRTLYIDLTKNIVTYTGTWYEDENVLVSNDYYKNKIVSVLNTTSNKKHLSLYKETIDSTGNPAIFCEYCGDELEFISDTPIGFCENCRILKNVITKKILYKE